MTSQFLLLCVVLKALLSVQAVAYHVKSPPITLCFDMLGPRLQDFWGNSSLHTTCKVSFNVHNK